MTTLERWAELRILESDLASRVFARQPARLISCGAGQLVSDIDWMSDRVKRLRRALAAGQERAA